MVLSATWVKSDVITSDVITSLIFIQFAIGGRPINISVAAFKISLEGIMISSVIIVVTACDGCEQPILWFAMVVARVRLIVPLGRSLSAPSVFVVSPVGT